MALEEDKLEKITRDQVASYLDIKPTETTPDWGLIGVGITSYGQALNPQVSTEKWIIHRNATSTVDSYQVQGDISQKMYKNDPCFEFANNIRRTAGIGNKAKSHVLDIDLYDGTDSGGIMTYPATKCNCAIAITNYLNEEAVIEYSVYYNGDPILGTVTIVDGDPIFTQNAE